MDDIEIDASSLDKRELAVVKAFGCLHDAKSDAFMASGYLEDGDCYSHQDTAAVIKAAAVQLRLCLSCLSHEVQAVAIAHANARGRYVRFIDGDGEVLAFIYVDE